jgi:hypothetical protein
VRNQNEAAVSQSCRYRPSAAVKAAEEAADQAGFTSRFEPYGEAPDEVRAAVFAARDADRALFELGGVEGSAEWQQAKGLQQRLPAHVRLRDGPRLAAEAVCRRGCEQGG